VVLQNASTDRPDRTGCRLAFEFLKRRIVLIDRL